MLVLFKNDVEALPSIKMSWKTITRPDLCMFMVSVLLLQGLSGKLCGDA